MEGRRLYGPNVTKWKFRCPSCGMVQTADDYRKWEAPTRDIDRRLGFSCVGSWILRVRPLADVVGFAEPHRGFGCKYVGGGLFRLNPVEVLYGTFKEDHQPATRPTFEWADKP